MRIQPDKPTHRIRNLQLVQSDKKAANAHWFNQPMRADLRSKNSFPILSNLVALAKHSGTANYSYGGTPERYYANLLPILRIYKYQNDQVIQ